MKDKYLGIGLLVTIGILFFAAFFAPEDGLLQTIVGFGIMLFGVWSGIRLAGKE